jgi:hypothetical protein
MKKLFLTGLLTLGFAFWVSAQGVYQNNGSIIAPTQVPIPQVDATTFINNGLFDIEFNSLSLTGNGQVITIQGVSQITSDLAPYLFSDVQTYTNRGTMLCDMGFSFDDSPATSGFRQMTGTFGNANTGVIECGSATNTFTSNLVTFSFGVFGSPTGTTVPTLKVWAANVVNRGVLDVGTVGFISLTGNFLDLARGSVHVEGLDDASIASSFYNIGIFNDYWGIGRQTNQLGLFNLTPPRVQSPFNNVTNAGGFPTFSLVTPTPYATAFANYSQDFSGSNVFIQVVYINTNLAGISTDVRWLGGGNPLNGGFAADPIIQWQAVTTNYSTFYGVTYTTNSLYLQDSYGSFQTNFLTTNAFTFSGAPEPQPYNYTFYRAFPFYTNLPHGDIPFDPSLYANAFPATNAYAALGVTIAPVTSYPDSTLAGSTFSNLPGRIEINASNSLDLTKANVTGANFLNLQASNHFVGCSNAYIDPPYSEINLGSTNGTLTISNLVPPYISRLNGPIDMWSGRWTNIVNGVTNRYHVLIVNAALSPTFAPQIMDCYLNSTKYAGNVFISDTLNVVNNVNIDATSLTITSNSVPVGVPPSVAGQYGQLNLQSPYTIWSNNFPGILCLTNFGLISAQGAAYFEGQIPYYQQTIVQPYNFFVNHGLISTYGDLVSTVEFQNTGGGLVISNSTGVTTTSNQSALIYSGIGPVDIQVTGTACMLNGGIAAPAGDLSISAASMTISNHYLYTSGALTLTASTLLTDTGVPGSNFWSVSDGMNLPQKPASGDLLGTTITNSAPGSVEVENIWAGTDRGATTAGFSNNVTVGHLILTGGDTRSQFYFAGPGPGKYALYVDLLDLRNGATNRVTVNGSQTFTAFDIADNMTIYYADAVVGGTLDVSEKLNGANGGHLVWVPAYAGPWSSTNVVYPAGVTNTFNRALVSSTDIDSNGNGVYNAYDPTPIYTPNNVKLSLGITNLPAKTPVLRWAGLANSTNIVFFKSNPASNWTAISTNIEGPVNGTMTFIDHGRTNSAGYYRVEVQAQQP